MKTKFNLFNTEWTIEYVDEIRREPENIYLGLTDYSAKTVTIATRNSQGDKLSDKELKLTLLHELMHAILMSGCYDDANTEPCVEWLANCIYSLLEQNVINNYKDTKKRRLETK